MNIITSPWPHKVDNTMIMIMTITMTMTMTNSILNIIMVQDGMKSNHLPVIRCLRPRVGNPWTSLGPHQVGTA